MAAKIKTSLNASSIEASIALQTRCNETLQPFVETLCALIDVVNQNGTQIHVPLTEIEYQQLAARLDDLLDLVGEEDHPLAPLLHFVGTLIKNYEDEHLPKLAEL